MYRTAQQGTRVSNAAALPLADPITVETRVGHPIGPHGGLGPSAFSCSLLPVPAGFPGGKTIGNGVDGAPGCTDGRTDGCTDNEPGPWHTRRRTVPAPGAEPGWSSR
ncbi:hypothetical protein ACFQ1I_01275 [Kitasatospora arboriphila]